MERPQTCQGDRPASTFVDDAAPESQANVSVMSAAIGPQGACESAGPIHSVKLAARIVDDTMSTFWREIERLSRQMS